MQVFVHSEAGDRHANEDAHVIEPHPELQDMLLVSLSDGQGGQFGGAQAGRTAAQTAVKLAASCGPRELLKETAWLPIIAGADDAVAEDPAAGYSTLVALVVSNRSLAGASVGDSAAFLRSDGQDRLLTDDQRKNPPVGSGSAYPIGFSASLRSPWTLLVVSDGVYRYIGWEFIASLVDRHRGRDLLEALVKAQKDSHRGVLGDDFTALLVQG